MPNYYTESTGTTPRIHLPLQVSLQVSLHVSLQLSFHLSLLLPLLPGAMPGGVVPAIECVVGFQDGEVVTLGQLSGWFAGAVGWFVFAMWFL